MRSSNLLSALGAACLMHMAATAPVSEHVESSAEKVEDAYHKVTDGVGSAFESTKHLFTGDPNAASPKHVLANHQSCTANDHLFFISYSINIGIPFDPQRCARAKKKLQDAEDVSHWQCKDDNSDGVVKNGQGMFRLWFNAGRGREKGLNDVLRDVFGEINGFNCPGW